MSPAPEMTNQAEEVLATETAQMCAKEAPVRRMAQLAELAQGDVRWRRLLNDPDNLFTGVEVISEGYMSYLLEMVSIMEDNGCTFKQAVLIASAKSDKSVNVSELGIVDYLKLRKGGYALSDALVYNLKASSLGSCRASSCAWRRKEAKNALAKGAMAVELADVTLEKGLDCTDHELTVVERSLAEAQHLCWHLDRALEILEANSRACEEGESVMAEYAELAQEAVCVAANLEDRVQQFCNLKARMWSFEYLGVMVRYLFTPPQLRRVRCCALPSTGEAVDQRVSKMRHQKEMRIEVVAATNLARLSELDESPTITGSGEVDGQTPVDSMADEEEPREVYVEVELGGCRRVVPLDDCGLAHRHMLFAYGGEPHLRVQVFEKSRISIQSLFAGDTLVGEAHLLLDAPAEDCTPRAVDLSVLHKGKQTGIVMLRYQLVSYM